MASHSSSIDLKQIHQGGGYSSEFDEDEPKKRSWRDDELSGVNRKPNQSTKIPSKQDVVKEFTREEHRIHKPQLLAMDAYSRHKEMINNYLLYFGIGAEHYKRDSSRDRNDYDVLREQHRFIWNEEDEAEDSWEKRLAKKYHDKLFKEYCISDLSRYKENKVAMRWRIEKEVISGKGQFICGNKTCQEMEGLRSWEVNFAYVEQGQKKNALVKLRLCPDCSYMLNYHHKRRPADQPRESSKRESRKRENKHSHKHKKRKKKKKRRESSEEDSDSDSEQEPTEQGESSSKTQSTETVPDEHDVWSGPAKVEVEKTREEEFDDYFAGMFL